MMELKKWYTIVGLILGLIALGGVGLKCWNLKASTARVEKLAGDYAAYKLTELRRDVIRTIMMIERDFGNDVRKMPMSTAQEYKYWLEELRRIDMQLNALYQGKQYKSRYPTR